MPLHTTPISKHDLFVPENRPVFIVVKMDNTILIKRKIFDIMIRINEVNGCKAFTIHCISTL